MNARAVKKYLMRGRQNGFWGRRAYLTVRLPHSVLTGVLPSVPTLEGFRADPNWTGSWVSEDGSEAIRISRGSTGVRPDPSDPEFFAPNETVATIEEDRWGSWQIWSGSRSRRVTLKNGEEDWEDSTEKVPVEFILAYRKYAEFIESLHEYGVNPVMDAFNEAGNSAKSTHWEVDDKGVGVTYGVKWFYAARKYRFCTDLAKALRLAHKEGKQGVIVRG